MIQTRIIGKLLRGKATTFQIASACVLGGLLGAQPGLLAAPGLFLLILTALLVLNANLFFAGLVAGFTKLASLALLAVQFEIGLFLIDGPLEPLARVAINAPVLAWFGFDNYVAVGGLALGGVCGGVAAAIIVKTVAAFRRKMAALEEGSDRYKTWSSKGWVKLLGWVLIGGDKGKKTYHEVTEGKALPIRVWGCVLAGVIVAAVVATPFVLTDGVVTRVVRDQLALANGATVDLEGASVDLAGGQATLKGLAVADRANLDRNLLEARTVDLNFSAAELLSKRFTVDEAVLTDARHDTARAERGVRFDRPTPTPPPPPSDDPNSGTIDDFLQQAEEWKERLEQLKEWLESRTPSDDADTAPADPSDPDAGAPAGESLRDRLRRQASESGYASVTADHLIAEHPRALIRELRVEGLTTEGQDGVFDVRGTNISTDPGKVADPSEIVVTSRAGDINVAVSVPGSAATGTDAAPSLRAAFTGLSADDLAAKLKNTGEPIFTGGTIDLSFNAGLPAGRVDAPLVATLKNSVVRLPQLGPQDVEAFTVPVRLSGPIDNPRVTVDSDDLADALAAAGKSAAANRLREEAAAMTDKALDKAGDAVPEDLKDKARQGLRSLLGGGGDDDDP